jgi:acetyl-CoA C-acetyltransferase
VTIDPRAPVIAGVGQVSQRTEPAAARPPLALWADAARLADDDAGGGLLARADVIAAVQMVSWPYPDPGVAVARELGVAPKHTVVSSVGGNSPQLLVNELAARIVDGDADVVLIGAGEAIHTRWRARREPRVDLDWPVYDDPPCAETIGSDRAPSTDLELRHGATAPVTVYPLLETAIRAAAERDVEAHQRHLGELWAHFAAVAAANPHAWSRTAFSAAEIARPSPENRLVTAPYPKRMCANIDVDQGAAVLLCSYEAARAAGVADDRMVFLHAGADASDHWFVIERPSLARSPAISAVVRDALTAAGVGVDDVARFDLYSCFPSAVELALDAIGLAGPSGGDARPLTVTGGLCFAGGPVNNYPTHALAAMTEALRADPGSIGLTTALGWYATKHSAGVWSTTPPAHGYRRVDPKATQAIVDAVPPQPTVNEHDGPAVVEATEVVMERDGTPAQAILYVRTPAGARTMATTSDPDLAGAMVDDAFEGRTVTTRPLDGVNLVVATA